MSNRLLEGFEGSGNAEIKQEGDYHQKLMTALFETQAEEIRKLYTKQRWTIGTLTYLIIVPGLLAINSKFLLSVMK